MIDVQGATTPIIALSWVDLVLAFGMVLVAIWISSRQGLTLARGFVVGSVRAVVQLILVGYILVYIFEIDRWYLVILALLVMLGAAAWTAVARQKGGGRKLLWIATVALFAGSGLTLLYMQAVVVRAEPWYSPRYLIPLFGMIVGNAMNAASLAAERLAGEIEARRAEIEAYLALGAAPALAAQEPVRRAQRAALIPTINGLMVVGLVSLPGMMTGQILAGASPVTAVRYQLVIMFMLTAAAAITAAIVALWFRRAFFTAAEQLKGS